MALPVGHGGCQQTGRGGAFLGRREARGPGRGLLAGRQAPGAEKRGVEEAEMKGRPLYRVYQDALARAEQRELLQRAHIIVEVGVRDREGPGGRGRSRGEGQGGR
jgi:hypothetical protein